MKKIAFPLIFSSCLLKGMAMPEPAKDSLQIYQEIDSLLQHKQFFAARDLLHARQSRLSAFQQLRLGAEIDNVFNQLEASNAKIDLLMQQHKNLLIDSVLFHLYEVRQSNYSKLYDYQKALDCANVLIDRYGHLIPEDAIDDYQNTRTIWQSLAGQPKQEVHITEKVVIKMSRDKAKLANLPLSNGVDSIGFIFDTGANISTITESAAARFGMTVFDEVINITSITGEQIKSRMAICKDLYLHSIHIKNAIFLVFPDAALYIPQIDYQIHGILGFPVINALGEVQISRKDEFTVPIQHSPSPGQNMALDFLTPVIEIGGDSYTFDTGADETMLYLSYFNRHEKRIARKYHEKGLTFGGAGGLVTKKGYKVDFKAEIGGKRIRLNNIMLFSEPVRESTEHYYGNIGQDVIRKFDHMTLNFKSMFIRFE